MASSFVSVVVNAHNAEATLPALLDALDAQTIGPDRFETIIVDDGSTDATARIARERPFVTLLSTPGGLGDASRNLGVRQARGEVIAITDSDCVPASDWLERALEDLDRLEVDAVAGHIEVALSRRPSLIEKIDYCRFLDQERAVREIGSGITANLVLRRSVFDRVGLFNERLFWTGDREFAMRAAEAGCETAYSPRASVRHPSNRSAIRLIRRSYRGGLWGVALRRTGTGPAAREQPIVWLRPGAYRPSRRVYGIERLEARRPGPSRTERLLLSLAQWALIQLPIVTGSIVGTLRAPTAPARG